MITVPSLRVSFLSMVANHITSYEWPPCERERIKELLSGGDKVEVVPPRCRSAPTPVGLSERSERIKELFWPAQSIKDWRARRYRAKFFESKYLRMSGCQQFLVPRETGGPTFFFFSISSLCQDMITISFLLYSCPGNNERYEKKTCEC